MRKELRAELRRIHDATGVTTILVTHDQEEAMALADRVVLMNHGRIEQIGAPEDLEASPASPFVFEFLGEVNRLPCEAAGGVARFEGFSTPMLGPAGRAGKGTGLFRPSDTLLDAAALTLKLTSHAHSFSYDPTNKEVINGLGGAALDSGYTGTFGYVVCRQRADMAEQCSLFDYDTNAVSSEANSVFAINADGSAATVQ